MRESQYGSLQWRLGCRTNPVYTIVDNTAPVVGTPIYTSNAVFWTSRENAPGQSILLTGAFTDATKTARLALIPPGTIDWQTLVRASSTVVSTTQQGTTGLSFIVPSSFPAGVYGFEIDDPSAPPILGLANVPALNWAIGVPSKTDSASALQHQVYDCGVEQGGILRLFGKNFVPSEPGCSAVVDRRSLFVPASKMDTNSITVPVPNTLAAGTYSVWVWNLAMECQSQVRRPRSRSHSPLSLSVRKVTCPHLVGDGVTDNTKYLQTCLDVNAPIGSREVAYLAIPGGNVRTHGRKSQHIPMKSLVGSSPHVD